MFDYNALRQKCLPNYEVVDNNHLYRSKPKLRGVLNMKEIRDMFNINIPNKNIDSDNTINKDTETSGFYNKFIQSVGKAQAEKKIGKSYLSKIIEKINRYL